MNTRSPTIKRILREAAELSGSPSPDYAAQPLESDLFEWHFTLRGPPNSVYSEGQYHGRIVLPPTYPLRPPMFRFSTPNGRFEANREICLSISGHHEETWQPAWGIRTALVALRSFMETEAHGQLGGLETTDDARKKLASASGAWRCPICQVPNAEIMKDCEKRSQESLNESEVAVPQELTMAWKDEMSVNNSELGSADGERKRDDDIALAEGFVQTASTHCAAELPRSSINNTSRITGASSSTAYEQPSGTQPPAREGPHTSPPGRATGTDDDDGTPLWIDRAIVVLVVVLFALLVKVFCGL